MPYWSVQATRDTQVQSTEPRLLLLPACMGMDEMNDLRSVKSWVWLIWRTYISAVWSS